jgi:SGNH hydrolase-like domain, acetyltransferase AlgX
MFMYRWAPMPALWRYKPNVFFDGIVYGDLATRDYRERRREVFQTDSYGFRNTPAQELEAREGRVDLILLGDSFGVGPGTTQEKTWGALFENKYGLHTYNLSMAGSGPWHELMNLKIACQRLRCGSQTTVLWALFAGNDLQDEIFDSLQPSLSENWVQELTVAIATFRNMSPIRNVWGLVLQRSHPSKQSVITRDLPDGKKLIFRPRYADAVRLSLDQVRQHPHYHQLVAVLGEMRRFSETQHFSVIVVVAPAKEEIYSSILGGGGEPDAGQTSGFAKAIEELCRQSGQPYLDLTPFFVSEAKKELPAGRLLWWSDDTHWNEEGNEFAAAVVHDHLWDLIARQGPSHAALRSAVPPGLWASVRGKVGSPLPNFGQP